LRKADATDVEALHLADYLDRALGAGVSETTSDATPE
jgi:hypothetical protein